MYDRRIDVAFVQETHCTNNIQKVWRNQWGGKIRASNYTSNAREVAILFRQNLDFEIINMMRDLQGRYMLVKIRYNNQTVLLCNIYAPNEDDPEFFNSIFQLINEEEADYFILGGDFNKVLNNEQDRKLKVRVNVPISLSVELINTFLEEQEWVDIWRYGHQDLRQFTWHR